MRSGQLIFSSGAHWRGLGQRCEWGSLFEAVGVREIFRVGGESGKRGASDWTAAPGGPSSKVGQKLAISPCHLSEPGLWWAGHVLGLSVSGMIHSFTYSAALKGQFWAKHMVGAGGCSPDLQCCELVHGPGAHVVACSCLVAVAVPPWGP